jgi:hypothetical protein
MTRLRYVPLDASKLGRLYDLALALRQMRDGVPINGEDRRSLDKVLADLDLISWRIIGRPLIGASGLGIEGFNSTPHYPSPLVLVRVVDGDEHIFGSYRSLGGDNIAVYCPLGTDVVRLRGKPEAEVVEKALRGIAAQHRYEVAQGWRKI